MAFAILCFAELINEESRIMNVYYSIGNKMYDVFLDNDGTIITNAIKNIFPTRFFGQLITSVCCMA